MLKITHEAWDAEGSEAFQNCIAIYQVAQNLIFCSPQVIMVALDDHIEGIVAHSSWPIAQHIAINLLYTKKLVLG